MGWDNIVSEDGFVNLFNGLDLQGWSMAGRGKFQVIEQEGALESEDGMGLLWYTNRMYGDFILKIDWRVKRRSDNSGVFIRFSDPGTDPWNAVKTGYEIQIDDLALPEEDGVTVAEEEAYYSSAAFHTLKGVKFSKQMTSDHTGGTLSSSGSPQELRQIKNHPVYRVIQNIRYDKSALHDIRLRTKVNGIWYLLSHSPSLSMNHNSKDIRVIKEKINQFDFKVTVHHTDTVSVVIGCSFSPVAVDKAGIIRLSNALIQIHDRLDRLIKDCNANSGLVIPSHMTWTVTMWHFGADTSILYKGKSFHVSWKVAENALVAFYSKVWKNGKRRIRGELHEYPGKPLDEALDEKLNLIGGINKIVRS